MYDQHDKFSISDGDKHENTSQRKAAGKGFMYVKKEKSVASKEEHTPQKRVHFKFDTDRGIKS